MKYLSLDIETTGLNPEYHDILQIGAVLDDLSVQAPLDELPCYRAYILPPNAKGYTGEPYALQMNQGILETIAKRDEKGRYMGRVKPLFVDPGEFMYGFANWCERQGLGRTMPKIQPGDHEKAMRGPSIEDIRFVPAGKNVTGFDLPFLRSRIPGWKLMRVAHRALDPGMLYFDPTQDKVPPNLSQCLERAGLDATVTHDAIDDAKQVIQLLRAKYPLELFDAAS